MSHRCTCRHANDPMREIDVILLEDVMRRYPVEVNATARMFQAGGLVFVLLALLGMLAHDVVRRDPWATTRAPETQTHQPILMP